MRRVLLVLSSVLVAGLPPAVTQMMAAGSAPTVEALAGFLNGRGEQVLAGAQLYDDHCSNCHGDTALGFAEAQLEFPEEEQRCTGCHRPHNPSRMAPESMRYNYAFSLGDPPALRGDDHRLASYQNGLTLYSYIRATMPRWNPGHLDDQDYLDITAFLLELVGTPLQGRTLTEGNAASFEIGD